MITIRTSTVQVQREQVTAAQWVSGLNQGRKTLEALAGSNITALDLRDCSRLLPEDYALLLEMPKLVDLKIGGFGINDKVPEYVAALPNLSGLTIEDAMISPEAFARMLETAAWKPKLAQLILSRNTTLFDDAILPVRHLPKLKRLTVNGMMVTGRFLAQLAENEDARPKLETLSLQKSLLTVDGAQALSRYRELKSLDLSGVAVTDELAEILATLDWPETIILTENRISEN